ncbi:MAG: hypothetical protein GY754_26875 [bacterium]|nr:hypothetical protein [bacterium]
MHKYDPKKKSHEELSGTLISGNNILAEVLKDLKPAKKKLTDQSWIITGARGAGKSHLITLLYREMNSTASLSKHWLPLIFPEDIFCVDSLYRLLLSIFENLFEEPYCTTDLSGIKAEYNEIKKIRLKGSLKEKKALKHTISKDLFDLLIQARDLTGKKIILLLENLQDIMGDFLDEDDLKDLRAFMHEHPDVFIIIGTALTVFSDLQNYSKPFFHFFKLRSLESLSNDATVDFLQQLADYNNNDTISARIHSNRHYIYTYGLLTGGNPRLMLFLYELLEDYEKLNTEIILHKITELTPYFLDKLKNESQQRKLILHALATGAPAQTATEIGEEINEDARSVTEQLKRLTNEGWVKEISIDAEDVKKKEVFFTLKDYFFRVWYKVRMGGIDESDVHCMAEMVVMILGQKEIKRRLDIYKDKKLDAAQLYEVALKLVSDADYMKNIYSLLEVSDEVISGEIKKLVNDIIVFDEAKELEKVIEAGDNLLKYMNDKNYKKIIELKPDFYQILVGIIIYCVLSGEHEKSYNFYSEYIRFVPEIGSSYQNLSIVAFIKKNSDLIFLASDELNRLMDEKATISNKIESISRLVLLDKFLTTTDAIDVLLKEKELPGFELKKLEFIIESCILINVSFLGKVKDAEITILIKYWVRIIQKRYKKDILKTKVGNFIIGYMSLTDIESISYKLVEKIINQSIGKDTEVSKLTINAIETAVNEFKREGKVSMVDPMYKLIVEFFLKK